MEWTTHALSGIVAGYTVTGGDWRGAIIGGVAGIIPDLDEPKSKPGRHLLPLSYAINQTFGHRTVTHSLLFAIIAGSILMPFFPLWVSLSVSAGILAHIAGDMLTGKVKLFFPSNRSYGMTVNRLTFFVIDRITGIVLCVVIVYELLEKMM